MPSLRCFTVARCQSEGVVWNLNCVHIVARCTDTHIIDTSLSCYTWWHGDGVRVRCTSSLLNYSCVGSEYLSMFVFIIRYSAFFDIRPVESYSLSLACHSGFGFIVRLCVFILVL